MTSSSSSRTGVADTPRVTGVCIDGNTLSAAALSYSSSEPVVEAVGTVELERLVERVDRITHPIFMDMDVLHYVDRNSLQRGLAELLSDPALRNPIMAVFPADCAKAAAESGSSADHMDRVTRGILSTAQSSNPNRYPRIVGVETAPAPDGEETHVWSARLSDVLACTDQFHSLGLPFLGVVTGKRALAEAMNPVCGQDGSGARTLIDVGRLRSVYVGAAGGAVRFVHAIPVGLARDNTHYFNSLPPRLSEVEHLQQNYGTLFLPAHGTPSGLFESGNPSPQVDCTRLAVQISRFAHRVVKNVWREAVGHAGELRISLSGRPSRIAGLKEFVSAQIGVPVTALDASPIPGLGVAGDVGWSAATDHLMPIGAGLAWFRREESRFGMVLRDRRPVRVSCADDLESVALDDSVFIVEHPPQGGSRIVARFESTGADSA